MNQKNFEYIKLKNKKIFLVVGAGHIERIKKRLRNKEGIKPLENI